MIHKLSMAGMATVLALLCVNRTLAEDGRDVTRRAQSLQRDVIKVSDRYLASESADDWKSCYELLDPSVLAPVRECADLAWYVGGVDTNVDAKEAKAPIIYTFNNNAEVVYLKRWVKVGDGSGYRCIFMQLIRRPSGDQWKVVMVFPSKLSSLFAKASAGR